MLKPVIERFLNKINVSQIRLYNGSPCWEWTSSKDIGGYGVIGLRGKVIKSHRFIYEYYHGEIDLNLQIDHLCRNRECCNVLHLEQVTTQENTRRGNVGKHMNQVRGKIHHNGIKTHCPQNHGYTLTNTYIYPNGRRDCKTCSKISGRKWLNRKRHQPNST